MEGQIDVLEGKQKTVPRMRDRIADLAEQLGALPPGTLWPARCRADARGRAEAPTHGRGGTGDRGAASLLDAQEEMRRASPGRCTTGRRRA